MAHEPERPDPVHPEALEDELDHITEVLVVGVRRPVTHRLGRLRGGSGNHEPVLVDVVVGREVAALPHTRRAAAVEIQQERQLALIGVGGTVQIELPAGRLIDAGLSRHRFPQSVRVSDQGG